MRHALVFNVISLLTFARGLLPPHRGLHLSVEFTSGTLVEVSYAQAPLARADSRALAGRRLP